VVTRQQIALNHATAHTRGRYAQVKKTTKQHFADKKLKHAELIFKTKLLH